MYALQQCRDVVDASRSALIGWIYDLARVASLASDFDYSQANVMEPMSSAANNNCNDRLFFSVQVDLVPVVPGTLRSVGADGDIKLTSFDALHGNLRPPGAHTCRECQSAVVSTAGKAEAAVLLPYCFGALRMRELLRSKAGDLFRFAFTIAFTAELCFHSNDNCWF